MSSPSPMLAESICGISSRYSITTAGSILAKKAVGPTTKKNKASAMASTRLILESHRMPLATPETAEKIVPMDSTTMITSAAALPVVDQPLTNSTPRPICSAPMPSVAAVPKRVAIMARPSMMRAGRESEERLPKSGIRMELISGTRPRRKDT